MTKVPSALLVLLSTLESFGKQMHRAQTGPIGIISVLIVSAITLLIGSMVLGQVDNTIKCTDIANGNGTAACNQTKNITWNVYKIIPITLLFLILGIFGIGRLRG